MKTYIAKLILIGSYGVGKSSIEQRLTKNTFEQNRFSTIGAAFSICNFDYENYIIKFEIWDTAGQERFRSLIPLYYRNATAAIIIYDITNYHSYIDALNWIKEIKLYDKNIILVLCGNKLDLQDYRQVSYNLENISDIEFSIETSAKTNVNINQMFKTIGIIVGEKLSKESSEGKKDIVDLYSEKKNKLEGKNNYCFCF